VELPAKFAISSRFKHRQKLWWNKIFFREFNLLSAILAFEYAGFITLGVKEQLEGDGN